MTYRFTINFHGDDRTASNMSMIFNNFGCPSTIVEVGVYEGYTTFWMSDVLAGHNSDLKIYAVDPHIGSNDLDGVDFNKIKKTSVIILKQIQIKMLSMFVSIALMV